MADGRPEESAAAWPQRLRRAALLVFFALVLLIPKILGLRRRRRSWNALRLTTALVGAVLVTAGKASHLGWLGPAAGLVFILLALLLRPAKQGKSVDEQARELGALVVVNGGQFGGAGAKPVPARLFVAPERVSVLDLQHRPLAQIALRPDTSVRVEQTAHDWMLLVGSDQATAEFHYHGVFAEHLARVAETTLRSQLQRELPILR